MTIRQLAIRLEMFPLPDLNNSWQMLDCPIETNCGRSMAQILRKATLFHRTCKEIGCPPTTLGNIVGAAWETCSILFYG